MKKVLTLIDELIELMGNYTRYHKEKDKKEIKSKLLKLLRNTKEWSYEYTNKIFFLSAKFDEYLWKEFSDVFEKHLSENKKDTFAWHIESEIFHVLGWNSRVDKVIEQGLKVDPNCPELLHNKALRHLERGEYDKANAILRDLIDEYQDQPNYLNTKAIVMSELGDDETALEISNRITSKYPDDLIFLRGKSRILQCLYYKSEPKDMRKLNQALQILENRVHREDKSSSIKCRIAMLYLLKKEFPLAKSWIQQIIPDEKITLLDKFQNLNIISLQEEQHASKEDIQKIDEGLKERESHMLQYFTLLIAITAFVFGGIHFLGLGSDMNLENILILMIGFGAVLISFTIILNKAILNKDKTKNKKREKSTILKEIFFYIGILIVIAIIFYVLIKIIEIKGFSN